MPKKVVTAPLPTTFKIGAMTVPITYNWDKIAEIGEKMPGGKLYGTIDYEEGLFNVRPNLLPFVNRDTLLHETLHMLFAFTQTDDLLEDGHDAEERFISRFTPALLMVLRDNPELVKYLVDAD